MRIFLIHHHQSQIFMKENYFICWGIVPVILSRSNTQTFKIFWWYSFIQLPTLYALNQALYTRASFSGEKISKSELETTFWICPHFCWHWQSSISGPAGKTASGGKIQNIVSSSDFDIFSLEMDDLILLYSFRYSVVFSCVFYFCRIRDLRIQILLSVFVLILLKQ